MNGCTAVLWGGPDDGRELIVPAPPPEMITEKERTYLLARPGINGRFRYTTVKTHGGKAL